MLQGGAGVVILKEGDGVRGQLPQKPAGFLRVAEAPVLSVPHSLLEDPLVVKSKAAVLPPVLLHQS